MPLELGKDSNQHWYFFEYNEFKPIFLSFPWTIETPTEQLKVIITRIDFPLKRQFRLRLQVYPEGEPLFSKFITLTKFHEQVGFSNRRYSTLSRFSRAWVSRIGFNSYQFTPN